MSRTSLKLTWESINFQGDDAGGEPVGLVPIDVFVPLGCPRDVLVEGLGDVPPEVVLLPPAPMFPPAGNAPDLPGLQ